MIYKKSSHSRLSSSKMLCCVSFPRLMRWTSWPCADQAGDQMARPQGKLRQPDKGRRPTDRRSLALDKGLLAVEVAAWLAPAAEVVSIFKTCLNDCLLFQSSISKWVTR